MDNCLQFIMLFKERFKPKVVYYPFGLVTHRSPHSFNLLLTNRTPRHGAGFRFIQVTQTSQVPSFTWIYSWTKFGVIRLQKLNEGFNQIREKYLSRTWQAKQLWLYLKFSTFGICLKALSLCFFHSVTHPLWMVH